MHRIAVNLIAIALVLPAGSTLAAEPVSWDQERATELAGQLAEGASQMRTDIRNLPPDTLASGQAHARRQLQDNLRTVERDTQNLHRHLQEGQGRDDTLLLFERIDSMRRDATEQARRMFLPTEALDRIKRGRETIDALRAYYTGGPDGPPDLRGPTRKDDSPGDGEVGSDS